MNPFCHFLSHRVLSSSPANHGFHFSRCSRCHADLMRSARAGAGSWREVPQGLRVCWGDFDADRPMPPWAIVTRARRAVDGIGRGVTALVVMSGVVDAIVFDTCRTLAGTIRTSLPRAARLAPMPRYGEPQRLSLVMLIERNMVHFEVKLARP